MRFLWLLILILILGILFAPSASYNYCNNATHVCSLENKKHFICELSDYTPHLHTTKYMATIPDTLRLREIFLSYFNEFRNRIASGLLLNGQMIPFPPASHMRVVIWDVELAYTARVHAATVSFKHSKCRGLQRFPIVGELIAKILPSGYRRSVTKILDASLRNHFRKHLMISDPVNFVMKFQEKFHPNLGTLALIVNDRISRVGCAIVSAKDCHPQMREGYCYLITCHFDSDNMYNATLYKMGESASDCGWWNAPPSVEYPNLCKNTGEYLHGPVLRNGTGV